MTMDNLKPATADNLATRLKKLFKNASGKFPFNNKGFIKLYRSPDGDGGAGGEGEGEGAEGGEGEGAGAGAGGDKGQKPWYDSLDTDLKTNPTITKFKSPAELGKSYVELQKAFGKDKVVVPTDKSTPEEWAAFYNKTGRPEKAEQYETPSIEGLPEELQVSADELKIMKDKAHELGINKKQFAEWYAFQQEMKMNKFTQSAGNETKAVKATETALRKELGAAYESKIDHVNKLLTQHFKDPAAIKLINQHLGRNLGFIKGMLSLTGGMKEDGLNGKGNFAALSPEQAKLEYEKVTASKEYNDDAAPGHQGAVDRATDLLVMMEAGKQ